MRRITYPSCVQQGVSLVELMITVAVLAIFASIALPSFASLIARNRVNGSGNELLATLHYARAESIRTNQPVRLCPSMDGRVCAGQDWHRWIVRTDAGVVIREGTVPPRVAVLAAGALLTGGKMAPDGALHGRDGAIQAGSLDLCDIAGRTQVRMLVEGGVRIALDSDAHGLCA